MSGLQAAELSPFTPAVREQGNGAYDFTEWTDEDAAEELRLSVEQFEAEVRHVMSLGGTERRTLRLHLVQTLPEDWLPDVHEVFEVAERRLFDQGKFEVAPVPAGTKAPTAPRVLPMTVFVGVAEIIQALGCSRSTAYEHLRRAARRDGGHQGLLRVPLAEWENYIKEQLGCRSTGESTGATTARVGGAGSTRGTVNAITGARAAPTVAQPKAFSDNSNVRPLIRLTQPKAKRP